MDEQQAIRFLSSNSHVLHKEKSHEVFANASRIDSFEAPDIMGRHACGVRTHSESCSDQSPRKNSDALPDRCGFDWEVRTGVLTQSCERTALRRSSTDVDDPNEINSGREQ